jgi:hypothetical protein
MLIDVAVPVDRNVLKKEAEKIRKYKDLLIKIQCMWNVKTKVTPVIIGATGTISKFVRKYLSSIPGKQGTTKNSYIGHSTHTAESTGVEAQKSLMLKTALYAPLTF